MLSTATKLKGAAFWSVPRHVEWIAMVLETIKSAHKDFREVKVIVVFLLTPIDKGFGEDVYIQWTDLDHVLVQLWWSYSVRTKLIYMVRNDPVAGKRAVNLLRAYCRSQ